MVLTFNMQLIICEYNITFFDYKIMFTFTIFL